VGFGSVDPDHLWVLTHRSPDQGSGCCIYSRVRVRVDPRVTRGRPYSVPRTLINSELLCTPDSDPSLQPGLQLTPYPGDGFVQEKQNPRYPIYIGEI